jgi:hypothetical protein
MWIFTPKGFVSIVADKTRPGNLLIRARKKKHLRDLFQGVDVTTTQAKDYRFRISIPSEDAARIVAAEIVGIDYPNFKNSIQEHDYHDACLDVWTTMLRFQGRQEKKYFDDILTALRNKDADAVFKFTDCNYPLPNQLLTPDAIPMDPVWPWPSIVQSFALTFNGYLWCENNGLKHNELFRDLFRDLLSGAQRTWTSNDLEKHTLSELRFVLFTLQRSYHDAWGDPDPIFVAELLKALKQKVESRLFD